MQVPSQAIDADMMEDSSSLHIRVLSKSGDLTKLPFCEVIALMKPTQDCSKMMYDVWELCIGRCNDQDDKDCPLLLQLVLEILAGSSQPGHPAESRGDLVVGNLSRLSRLLEQKGTTDVIMIIAAPMHNSRKLRLLPLQSRVRVTIASLFQMSAAGAGAKNFVYVCHDRFVLPSAPAIAARMRATCHDCPAWRLPAAQETLGQHLVNSLSF